MKLSLLLGVITALVASAPSQESTLAKCTTSQLQIRMVKSYVAAGNVGGAIAFRNRSRSACSLRGWPSLVAFVAREHVRARRVRSTMLGPYVKGIPTVTLRPGETAKAAFAAGDQPPSGRTCGRPYRRLRVAPPGNVRAAVVSAWLPALDAYLPACTAIDVTMVVRAADLRGG